MYKRQQQGEVIRHDIFESVIHSDYRMTYSDVNAIIENDDQEIREKYSEITPMLDLAQQLSKQLIAKRKRRGEIDFDIKEAQVLVDEDGIPTDLSLIHI